MDNLAVEIRQLVRDDAVQLGVLIEESYADAPYGMWFAERPKSEEISKVVDAKIGALESGTLIDLVALSEGKVVGDCEVVKQGEEGILGILVAARYRGAGVGQSLLVNALRAARLEGLKSVVADVSVNNPGAHRFFIKNGFAITGAEPQVVEKNGKQEAVVRLSFVF